MGGAVTSVRGDLDVALMNPAALELYRYPQTFRVGVVLDVVAPAFAAADWASHPQWKGLDTSEAAAVFGLFLKGLMFRWNFLDVVLSLGKDLSEPDFPVRGTWTRDGWRGFPEAHGHYLVARLRPTREVSIGASVFYAQRRLAETVARDLAVSYGVLVTSHEGLRFGLAYLTFPEPARERLLWENRTPHATLNLGISKTWTRRFLLAFDVRNLSDEGKPAAREFHVGAEWIALRHLALRGGAFRTSEDGKRYVTFGLGLLDRNRFVAPDRFLRDACFTAEYAVRLAVKGAGVEHNVTHYISCLLRL